MVANIIITRDMIDRYDIPVDNETVSCYLQHIADAFFYEVKRYDIMGRAHIKTQNKYYVCDMGFSNVLIQYRQLEVSLAIENIVYVELIYFF